MCLYQAQIPVLPDCQCVLFNLFAALEGDILNAMAWDMNSNVYIVGPLILSRPNCVEDAIVAMVEAGGKRIPWLDEQNPNLVFVSFGSMATISMEQMAEFS